MTLQNPKNARGQAAISASAVRRTHLRSVAAAALLTLLPLARACRGLRLRESRFAHREGNLRGRRAVEARRRPGDGVEAGARKRRRYGRAESRAVEVAQAARPVRRRRAVPRRSLPRTACEPERQAAGRRPLAADVVHDERQPVVRRRADIHRHGAAPAFRAERQQRREYGRADGDIVLHGDSGTYRKGKCRLDFERKGGRIGVTQHGADFDCGASRASPTTASM